jgi:hypothetical protein
MFECDAHIYAYQGHLVCLHAHNLSFVRLITTLFMREGDQVKPMILGPVLAIRVSLVTCMFFLSVLL